MPSHPQAQTPLRPHLQRENISETSPLSAETERHFCAAVQHQYGVRRPGVYLVTCCVTLGKSFCIWSYLTPALHLQQNVFGQFLPSAFSHRADNGAGAARSSYMEGGGEENMSAGYKMLLISF